MTYIESIGANCSNCGNRGKRGHCNRKCIDDDTRPGWEPAEGVMVQIYSVDYPELRVSGLGRRVIEKEAV